MHTDEFARCIRELTDTFGERHYPDTTKNRIWKIVCRITYGDFRSAVERLCEDNTRAPTAGEIRRTCGPALQRARQAWISDQIDAMGEKCAWCDNTGHLFAIKNGSEHLHFQFRCHCKAAEIIDPKGLPPWQPEKHGKQFTPASFDASELIEEMRLAAIARGHPLPEKRERTEWDDLADRLLRKRAAR